MLLSKEGIFPITIGLNNENVVPLTGFNYSGTVQGEGILNGVPSIFIRLAGCNLRCEFRDCNNNIDKCDTPYTSWINEGIEWDIKDIVKVVKLNTSNIKHVVITGGEPFVHGNRLTDLCSLLSDYHITVETNATIFNEHASKYIKLFSLSPKLSNSIPYSDIKWSKLHDKYRKNIKVIQQFIDLSNNDKDYQLKFVISNENDIKEIQNEYLSELTGVDNHKILLMPIGSNRKILEENTNLVLEQCIKYGYRFGTRLHINFFKNNFGV